MFKWRSSLQAYNYCEVCKKGIAYEKQKRMKAKEKQHCKIKGWKLITSFSTFAIPGNYSLMWFSSTFGGFDKAELFVRNVRPKFRPLGRKAKFGARLLVFHLCSLFPIDLDVVFTVGNFFLYQARWGGKRNGKQILAMTFIVFTHKHTSGSKRA